MWEMSIPLTADPGFLLTGTALSTQILNHAVIPIYSHSSSTRYTATVSAIALQYICPWLLKGPVVSFCPHRDDLALVHWEDWFQNTSAQLSPAGKAQENAPCFRPDCLYPISHSAGSSLRRAWKALQLGINQLRINIHWSVKRTSRWKCFHWSILYLILHPKFKHFWIYFFYLPVNFSTFLTMAPMPSKILCNSVSHINAGVVTTLFFVSTWAS